MQKRFSSESDEVIADPKKTLKILILGLNYAPELVGIAVYTTGLAEALVERGHQVRVVAGKPYYPAWSVFEQFRGGWKRRTLENGVDVTRVAHYVPAKPTGLRRILHHASFAVSACFPTVIFARQQKPDIVFTVAPSLVAAPIAQLAAWISGARAWLHIQDFEVEAAVATGLIRDGIVSRLAAYFETKVLGGFHKLSSISGAMCKKCILKMGDSDRVTEFRNWAEVDRIRPLARPSSYRAEWGITTPHVALYSGNIGNKQGIEIIIGAARRLRHRTDLTFVICGEGSNRSTLENAAGDLSNIIFRSLQPKERLEDLLGLASIHLLPQLGDAGDLVLPSKLTNMLSSGRPIIATAAFGTELALEVATCGIVTPPEDEKAFAEAIELLVDEENLRSKFSKNARTIAEDRWSRDVILARFEQQLMTMVADAVSDDVEEIRGNATAGTRAIAYDLKRSRLRRRES